MHLRIAMAVALWGAAVFGGVDAIVDHDATPGARAATPTTWPAESTLPHHAGAPTVLMFVHEECPCTRASYSELAEVARSLGPDATLAIVFAGPVAEVPAPLAAATRVADLDGAEAARFGARTSGFVVVYRPDGALGFSGGITGARGHAGDNVGRRAAIAALAQPARADAPSPTVEHAVLGCALRASAAP